MAMIPTFRSSGQTSPSPATSRNRRSSVSRLSAPRYSKGLDAFDLASFLDNLPPNTGPLGVVAVTGNGTNTNNSSKNLSHVPCKFFKQGICQAGKSCPFSHSLEGSLSADKLPCKYFQKGNCKFGLKCALAHILPDGTRVNMKNMLPNRRNHERHEKSHNHGHGYLQNTLMHSFQPPFGNSKIPAFHTASREEQTVDLNNEQGFYGTEEFADSCSPNFISQNTTALLRDASYCSGEKYISQNTQQDVTFGNATGEWLMSYSEIGRNGNGLGNGLFTSGSLTSSSAFFALNESPLMNEPKLEGFLFQLPLQQVSANRRASSTRQLSSSSSSSSPLFNYNSMLQADCAIADDEDELVSEDTYFEDYIPASLGNLIFTPQEKKRRDSRSQSGTLLVRPDIYQEVGIEKRLIFPTFLDGPSKDQSEVFLMD